MARRPEGIGIFLYKSGGVYVVCDRDEYYDVPPAVTADTLTKLEALVLD